MKKTLLAFLLFFSVQVFAQTEFLMMPSNQDLTELSHIFEETGRPFPVHIIYGKWDYGLHAMGIAVSEKVRNGVHARLMVSAGLVPNLRAAKYFEHKYNAGTLFLEIQNGQPVLAFHGRNSVRSTVNAMVSNRTSSPVFTTTLLKKIAEHTGLPVVNASRKLNKAIDAGNREKYLADAPFWKRPFIANYNGLRDRKKIHQEITDFEPSNLAESHPGLVDTIIENRMAMPKSCAQVSSGIMGFYWGR